MRETAPIKDPLVDSVTGLATIRWIYFFNYLSNGDQGDEWTPLPVNLAVSGTPIYSARYFQDGNFTDFEIIITPATNTSSTAGSTYIPLPFDVITPTGCFALSSTTSIGLGTIDAANNRVYPPTWTTITVPVIITGRVRSK